MQGYEECLRGIEQHPHVPTNYVQLCDLYENIGLPYDAYLMIDTAYALLGNCADPDLSARIVKRHSALSDMIKRADINKGRASVLGWGKNVDGCCGVEGTKYLHHPAIVERLNGVHVVDLSCGMCHAVAVTSHGRVLVWGANNYGQCGVDLSVTAITTPTIMSELIDTPVKAAACGGAHTVVIAKTGEVFAWGLNSLGQCGVDSGGEKIVKRTHVEFPAGVSIQACTCGLGHTVFLSETEGTVYSCGWNVNGQLGLGSAHQQSVKTPQRVRGALSGEKVIHASCGGNHTMMITASGKAFGTGLNSSGQLGLANTEDSWEPKLLESLKKVQSVYTACGEEFSFVVSYEKEVYGMGLNNVGQLGLSPDEFPYSPVPLLVGPLMGKGVESISCGKGNAIAITDTGASYGWGLKPLASLVDSDGAAEVTLPKKMPMLEKAQVVEIKSGREFYLILQNAADPSQSVARSTSFEHEVEPLCPQRVLVQTLDSTGIYCTTGGDRLALVATDMLNTHMVELTGVKIADGHDGSYEVLYALPAAGKYLVYIICNGMPLGLSPYMVTAAAKEKLPPDPQKCALVVRSKEEARFASDTLCFDSDEKIVMALELRDKFGHECDATNLRREDIEIYVSGKPWKEAVVDRFAGTVRFGLKERYKHRVEARVLGKRVQICIECADGEKVERKRWDVIYVEVMSGHADPARCRVVSSSFKLPGPGECVRVRSGEIQDYVVGYFDSDGVPTTRHKECLRVQCAPVGSSSAKVEFPVHVSEPESSGKPEAVVTFKTNVVGTYRITNRLGEIQIQSDGAEILLKVTNGRPDYLFSRVHGDLSFRGCINTGEKLEKQVLIEAVDTYGNKCENLVDPELDIQVWLTSASAERVKLAVSKLSGNTYKAPYTLAAAGTHRLEVAINEQKAIGSPFEIKLERNPVEVEAERKLQEQLMKKLEEEQRREREARELASRSLEEKQRKEEAKKAAVDEKEMEKRKQFADKFRRLQEFKKETEKKRRLEEQRLKEKMEKKRKRFKHCGGGFVVPFLEEQTGQQEVTLKLQNFFAKEAKTEKK